MSVLQVDPPDFGTAKAVIIYTDAENQSRAIADINSWARDHGFERTNEAHLRHVYRQGKAIYKGFCYRPE